MIIALSCATGPLRHPRHLPPVAYTLQVTSTSTVSIFTFNLIVHLCSLAHREFCHPCPGERSDGKHPSFIHGHRAEAPGMNNQLLPVAAQVLPMVEAFTVHGSKLEKLEGQMK